MVRYYCSARKGVNEVFPLPNLEIKVAFFNFYDADELSLYLIKEGARMVLCCTCLQATKIVIICNTSNGAPRNFLTQELSFEFITR